MGLFDSRLFSWLQPSPRATTSPEGRPSPRTSARALAGGRLTSDEFGVGFFTIASPPDADSQWRVQDLDTDTLSTLAPARLVELLSDISPEVSNGVWNFLRLCNPGWEAIATRPGSDEADEQAQAALDSFLASCTGVYDESTAVPFDTIVNNLFLAAFMRGGLLAELVLSEDGRTPVNLATPDPYVIRFKLISDPVRGDVWQMGQYHNNEWVALNRETVRYVPIDPLPGNPYGRAMVSPALFTSLFLIGLLHDLRRVVAQQGYPRLDISIALEQLAQNAPPESQPGTEGWQAWVQAVIDEISGFYSQLEPDDAYVHTDVISVNRPVGTINAESLGMVDSLISRLERMAARAMKMMPLLLGIDDATSDANANRQWEIQAAGIKSIQHLCESLLERLLTLALQCQGIQATVSFRFAELRAAELLRDAMTEQLTIANTNAMYAAGWISQDEASQNVTGHAADMPQPRMSAGASTAVPPTAVPPTAPPDDSDSAERIALLHEIRAARAAVEAQMETAIHAKRSANGVH